MLIEFLYFVKTNLTKNYFRSKGRASVSEFWLWQVFYWGNIALINLIDWGVKTAHPPNTLFDNIWHFLFLFYALFLLIPSINCTVRRLHDTNRSGWFILVALIPVFGEILLVLRLTEIGNEEQNRFGDPPSETETLYQ